MECSFQLMVFSLFQEDLPFNTPWWALQCVSRRLCIREAPESLAFSLQSRAALCRCQGPHWLVWVSELFFFFFFNLFIYFNWRIITLQYCDDFVIHQRKSAVGIHVSPPNWNPFLPHLLSKLSQSPGFGCPASCIKVPLVLYFTCGNIYVSVLFSQITPPSPSPTESKSLFFTWRLLWALPVN